MHHAAFVAVLFVGKSVPCGFIDLSGEQLQWPLKGPAVLLGSKTMEPANGFEPLTCA
jgi:hypothetical protein